MDWNLLITNLLTAVVTIIVALIPVAVPIVLNRLFDKWGAVADTERRKALTTAIVNGLIQSLDTRGIKKDQPLTSEEKLGTIADAADYAAKTVPQTIKKLGVREENLIELARSHLPQVLGTFGPAGALIGAVGAAVLDAVDGKQAKQGRG
jgi:hypothetical protein